MKTIHQIRNDLRKIVAYDYRRGILTSRAVTAVAALHMTTDNGRPISPALHHKVWLSLLCDSYIDKLFIVATPDSAKTTWIIAYAACLLGFYPDSSGIFVSSTGSVAETRSLALRNIVDSDEYRLTFPHVVPVKMQGDSQLKWAVDKWSVATNGKPHDGRIHASVSAYGTGGSITGSRAKWLIGDDILDYENTRTAHQRNSVKEWAHKSLFNRVESNGGITRFIGNAWHMNDLHGDIRRSQNWVTCHMAALYDKKEAVATITYPHDYQGQPIGEPLVNV